MGHPVNLPTAKLEFIGMYEFINVRIVFIFINFSIKVAYSYYLLIPSLSLTFVMIKIYPTLKLQFPLKTNFYLILENKIAVLT